jgi:hypothetical protein
MVPQTQPPGLAAPEPRTPARVFADSPGGRPAKAVRVAFTAAVPAPGRTGPRSR